MIRIVLKRTPPCGGSQLKWLINGRTAGELIDVRVTVDDSRGVATVYENAAVCKETNLRLEPDGEWEDQQFVCVAFGTGVTPFLSYIHYMAHQKWEMDSEKQVWASDIDCQC